MTIRKTSIALVMAITAICNYSYVAAQANILPLQAGIEWTFGGDKNLLISGLPIHTLGSSKEASALNLDANFRAGERKKKAWAWSTFGVAFASAIYEANKRSNYRSGVENDSVGIAVALEASAVESTLPLSTGGTAALTARSSDGATGSSEVTGAAAIPSPIASFQAKNARQQAFNDAIAADGSKAGIRAAKRAYYQARADYRAEVETRRAALETKRTAAEARIVRLTDDGVPNPGFEAAEARRLALFNGGSLANFRASRNAATAARAAFFEVRARCRAASSTPGRGRCNTDPNNP